MTKKQHAAMVRKDRAKMKEKMEMQAKTVINRLTEMTCMLLIPMGEAERMQKILNGPQLTAARMKALGQVNADTIKVYEARFATAEFDTEMVMFVAVCNGNTPFVDAILFEDGEEVGNATVTDTLLGTYKIDYEGVTYKAIVKAG